MTGRCLPRQSSKVSAPGRMKLAWLLRMPSIHDPTCASSSLTTSSTRVTACGSHRLPVLANRCRTKHSTLLPGPALCATPTRFSPPHGMLSFQPALCDCSDANAHFFFRRRRSGPPVRQPQPAETCVFGRSEECCIAGTSIRRLDCLQKVLAMLSDGAACSVLRCNIRSR